MPYGRVERSRPVSGHMLSGALSSSTRRDIGGKRKMLVGQRRPRAVIGALIASALVIIGIPYQAHAASPTLTISSSALQVNSKGTITATLKYVPAGQTARIVLTGPSGMICASTRWASPGVATTTCTFLPRAAGGYTITAKATRFYSGRVVSTQTVSSRLVAQPAPPTLTISSSLRVNNRGTVTATLKNVPTGQSARISASGPSGMTCDNTKWISPGVASTTCTFLPLAAGAYTVTATATRFYGGRVVAVQTVSSRVAALGVTAIVAGTVRRGEATTVRFTVGGPLWSPGAVLRIAPGVAGAVGCPAELLVRLSADRTASATCKVTPQPTRFLTVAPDLWAGKTRITGVSVRAKIADGPLLDATLASSLWGQESATLWELAKGMTAGSHDAASTGFEIILYSRREGWAGPNVASRVQHLLDVRKPDGGWGIEKAWDAFGDGTVNRESTTYTVSTAGHAGPALLGAWQNKLVTDEDLRAAVDSLLSTPRVNVPGGTCVAYSNSGKDLPCVPNVSLGAGAWLKQVREVTGWSIPLLDDVVAQITAADRYLFNEGTGYWGYSDLPSQLGRPQDAPHQGYTLQSVLILEPDFGKAATLRFLANPWWDQATGGSLRDYGNGLSQVAFADCQGAARSPSVLEAFSAIKSTSADQMTKFLALQGTLYGFRALGACFSGETW